MSEYLYSISGDITLQSVDAYKLQQEIEQNLTLSSATFRGVITKGDDLYILFDKNIEVSEKTTLDTIVQIHNSTAVPLKSRYLLFYPDPKETSNSYYTTTGCLFYPGSSLTRKFTAIDAIGYMSQGATSYDVQLVNRANNTIVAEQNFTNTLSQLQSFNTVHTANIPCDQASIEVLIRLNKTGNTANKIVHLDQVVFWLD